MNRAADQQRRDFATHQEVGPPGGRPGAAGGGTTGSSWQTLVVTFNGVRYRIQRRPGLQDGTIRERWSGRGVLGSERHWLGHRHTERLYWYAAINPTCEPFHAVKRVENLPSRRAAIRWLLSHTEHEKP